MITLHTRGQKIHRKLSENLEQARFVWKSNRFWGFWGEIHMFRPSLVLRIVAFSTRATFTIETPRRFTLIHRRNVSQIFNEWIIIMIMMHDDWSFTWHCHLALSLTLNYDLDLEHWPWPWPESKVKDNKIRYQNTIYNRLTLTFDLRPWPTIPA